MVLQRLLIILLFLLISAVLLTAGGEKDSVSTPDSLSGVLEYLEGDVFINNVEANFGDTVRDSDTLRTGSDSYCEVVFGERNIFRLEENTIVRIDWARSNINITEGSIGAVFTKLDKFLTREKDFTLTSPSMVAGIRGTVFFIRVEDSRNTYLCLCNGELDLTETCEGLNAEAVHHQAFRFTLQSDDIGYSPAAMLYHDDAKMESIADGIDYTIPWGASSGSY